MHCKVFDGEGLGNGEQVNQQHQTALKLQELCAKKLIISNNKSQQPLNG